MVWRTLPWNLLLCVLVPTLVFAAGNASGHATTWTNFDR